MNWKFDIKPKPLLILGFILAVLTLAAGMAGHEWQERRLDEALSECHKGPEWRGFRPLCKVEEVRGISSPVGVQAEIASADKWKSRFFWIANNLAPFILMLFALPFIWYFLLDRISELRDAITGSRNA